MNKIDQKMAGINNLDLNWLKKWQVNKNKNFGVIILLSIVFISHCANFHQISGTIFGPVFKYINLFRSAI